MASTTSSRLVSLCGQIYICTRLSYFLRVCYAVSAMPCYAVLSSKKCSACKKVNKDLQLSERTWQCPNCGLTHDRDINTAINILEEAASSAVSACGEGSAGFVPMNKVKLPFVKQELNAEFAHVST